MTTRPTTAQRLAALDALRAGASPTEAARLSGVGVQSCSKWRRELGMAPMAHGHPLSVEKRAAVEAHLRAGKTQAEAATLTGVSVGAVNGIARGMRDGNS